jgi:hypothetical protein
MDFHIGDNLLSGCLTSIGCFPSIFTLGVGVFLIASGTSFMMGTWIGSLSWRMPT